MKYRDILSKLNIDSYGSSQKVLKWLQSFDTVFAYRIGYELTNKGKVKPPTEYKVTSYEDSSLLFLYKIKGSGHSRPFSSYTHEYEFFTDKESALEYANGDPLKKWNEENDFKNNQLYKLNEIYKKISKEEQEFLKDYISGVSYGKYEL